MTALSTFELLPLPIRLLSVSAHRTALRRVLGVNPCYRNPLERCFVQDELLDEVERQVMQASIHSSTIVDVLTHLLEVFKDDTWGLRIVGTTLRLAEIPYESYHVRTASLYLQERGKHCTFQRFELAFES